MNKNNSLVVPNFTAPVSLYGQPEAVEVPSHRLLASHVTRHPSLPITPVQEGLAVNARRYPDKLAIEFYGQAISYNVLQDRVLRLAGYLTESLAVKPGDRVLVDMQNSPSFVVAFYAVLAADAVVVPVNPMNLESELRWLIEDSGAKVVIAAQDIAEAFSALLEQGVFNHLVLACYSDDLPITCKEPIADFLIAPRQEPFSPAVSTLAQACDHPRIRRDALRKGEDLAMLVYTSGTTGHPKGCMLSHRAVNAQLVALEHWNHWSCGAMVLATAPFFHVTGLCGSMLLPLALGASVVILPRWDRSVAMDWIESRGITHWTAIPTMVIDLLGLDGIERRNFSSIQLIGGGGTAMPNAVAKRLQTLTGLCYQEGWGMSEVCGAIHLNPPGAVKPQCLGIAMFDVDTRIIDIDGGAQLYGGEQGEIVTRCPTLFSGYWNNPQATFEALVELDGRLFLRTGDIGSFDCEGYLFMAERLKRMINVSGYKVWPSEVENMLYQHPAIQEACVIAGRATDGRETVKALVVRKSSALEPLDAERLMSWSRQQMAAYKIPRLIEFVDALPKSATGKIQWRELQNLENQQ
ncbi:long-chain-fatty-acid--CoA ligase [Pseudomonas vancouverensis]|uniref:Long-chain fatty acid--CoA ligase n=1 Tax=Pseudomonas vancouverensis TaxID=95300 RepID=A0A1H2MG43_PSEVA|nr:long-chain-fatty-acid--CoA ligase [Pseudomonas vancouverensis]KAB0499144.1 AMP-binding protein [Pseudomonas vancouverensis]TDB59874.1 long-chain fatty acid--CoA ligase [Pseudomonas vancouverensis]SDU91456.1 fatty-acyl-CoA synthase [Pseudomonas vancouverensis]